MSLSLLVALLGIASSERVSAWHQPPRPACAWDTPSKAVSEFLLFELNGGRLSSDRWLEYTTKYIASFEGYDEPGWDRATVVSRYKIRDLNCATESSCEASVSFTLYPTRKLRELIVVPHRNGGTMVKRYFMVKKDDSWLIKPIEPCASDSASSGAKISPAVNPKNRPILQGQTLIF